MKAINEKQYLSDEGKVFQHKKTKLILGWGIYLGDNDSINNYKEIKCPDEYKGNEAYDNLLNKEKHVSKKHDKLHKRKPIK
jgi:hypothetical protein